MGGHSVTCRAQYTMRDSISAALPTPASRDLDVHSLKAGLLHALPKFGLGTGQPLLVVNATTGLLSLCFVSGGA